MDPISWQVSLVRFLWSITNKDKIDDKQPVGFHFFMGLYSSDGLVWGNGPMRVGGLGPTDCLAPGSMFVLNNFFVNNTNRNFFIKVPKQLRFPALLGQV